MHVVTDATSLKVYGAGEWLVEKHSEHGNLGWRKLYLAVDPSSGEVLASELTSNDEGDTSQVGPLLKQILGPIASVTADGTYDGEPVCCAVAEPQSDPPVTVIILPRSTAVPSSAANTSTSSQCDEHIQIIRDKGRIAWQRTTGYDRSMWKRRCCATMLSSAATFVLGLCLPRRLRRKSDVRCSTG